MKFSYKNTFNWALFIGSVTLLLSATLTIVTTTLLAGVGWGIGVLIVFSFILMGIFFDAIGIAATAAQERPFHSMAAEKLDGAKQAIKIIRNADKFSNFCNDVIGDISGIISGTASAIVVLKLITDIGKTDESFTYGVLSVLFTATVSALTVGGKAIGKSIAIHYSTPIILETGKFFSFLERKFKIVIFNEKKNKRKAGGKNETP